MNNNAPAEIAERIRKSERVIVCAHTSPDPDAIGSTLALGLVLETQGKQAVLLNDDPVPPNLRYLPGHEKIKTELPENFNAELIITLDCGDKARLGEIVERLHNTDAPVVNIDHHITNEGFGAYNLVIPECASTAEVLMIVFDEMGVQLTDDIATCLMTGFVGDTITFSTNSLTPQTLQFAARLMEYDVNLTFINETLFNKRSLSQLRIWGIGIGNTQFADGVIWSVVPYTAQKEMGVTETSLNRLSSLLISVNEAAVAGTFREDEDGSVRISMRAKPGFDVAAVASALGGGGHIVAAGATANGPLKDVVKKTVKLLQQQVRLGERV